MNINSTSVVTSRLFFGDHMVPSAPPSEAQAVEDLRTKINGVKDDLMTFEALAKRAVRSTPPKITVVSVPSTTFLRYYVVPHESPDHQKSIRPHELELAIQGAREKLQALEQEKKTLVQEQERHALTLFKTQIDAAQHACDDCGRSHALTEVADRILNAGYSPSAAIKVAAMIPLKNIQGTVLQRLSQRLFDYEDVSDSLLCVESIGCCAIQTDALDKVRELLSQIA